MGLPRRPGGGERGQVRIGGLRQHDLQRDILIAIAATALGGALALEPQRLAGVGMGRQGQHDAAGNGGNIDLAAEDRFAQRNRHVDADIVAVAGEDGMRADMDLDQRIAGRAAA